MKRIKSKSEKRLIIQAEVNGNEAFFLLDTGASVGIMDDRQKKRYGLKPGRRYPGTLLGASGELTEVRHCDTFAVVEEKVIPQFLLADIGLVVDSIKKETGISVLGIISLPQMKLSGLGVDSNDMEIIIE